MLKRLSLLNNLVKYLIAAILLAVPLYPKFPLINVPGTFVSIRLEDTLILLALGYWLVIYFSKLKKLLKDKVLVSVSIFLFVGLISVISAIFITKTVIPHIAFLHWARRIEYFIPLLIGMHAFKDNKNIRFYFFVLLMIYVYTFIYGFGQRYLNWPIIITQNEEYSKGVALRWVSGSHINSTFAGHYDLATFLVMTMPMVISAIFVVNNWKNRVVYLIVSLMGLWLLVNSASRISLVSYMLGATLSLLIIKRAKFIPIVLILSIVFIGFSSNLQARYARIFQVGREKLQDFKLINFEGVNIVYAQEDVLGLPEKRIKESPTPTPIPLFEDRSTSIRFNVEWPRALRAFTKNPLLGTGYSSITLATDNDFLRLLGEVGVLGFFAFLLIFMNIGEKFLRFFHTKDKFEGLELAFAAGFIASLPGVFINAFFIDIFEASKFAILFWLMTGMSLSLLKTKK